MPSDLTSVVYSFHGSSNGKLLITWNINTIDTSAHLSKEFEINRL